MRKLTVLTMLLTLFVVASFAGSILSDTSTFDTPLLYSSDNFEPLTDVLWENPYDYSLLTEGAYSYSTYHSQDDFVLTTESSLEGFELWTCYSGSHPRTLEVALFADDGGSPGTELWRVTVDPGNITDTDTGDDKWGFDLFHTVILLDPADYHTEAAGTYWVEFYDPGGTLFAWLCEDGGNLHQNDWESWFDAFFAVLTNVGSTIEETTWGQIKAL
ncbi:hypothetical protein K8R78_02250 [bacterium]|nr:hypothetical protein [bacterium]